MRNSVKYKLVYQSSKLKLKGFITDEVSNPPDGNDLPDYQNPPWEIFTEDSGTEVAITEEFSLKNYYEDTAIEIEDITHIDDPDNLVYSLNYGISVKVSLLMWRAIVTNSSGASSIVDINRNEEEYPCSLECIIVDNNGEEYYIKNPKPYFHIHNFETDTITLNMQLVSALYFQQGQTTEDFIHDISELKKLNDNVSKINSLTFYYLIPCKDDLQIPNYLEAPWELFSEDGGDGVYHYRDLAGDPKFENEIFGIVTPTSNGEEVPIETVSEEGPFTLEFGFTYHHTLPTEYVVDASNSPWGASTEYRLDGEDTVYPCTTDVVIVDNDGDEYYFYDISGRILIDQGGFGGDTQFMAMYSYIPEDDMGDYEVLHHYIDTAKAFEEKYANGEITSIKIYFLTPCK